MTKEELHNLLQINVKEGTEPVLIYTKCSSERFIYTCRFVFCHVLGVNFIITHNHEEFIRYKGAKIVYGLKLNENHIEIPADPIIDETGLRPAFIPESAKVNDCTVFFPDSAYNFGFDLFASIFYFISCYQEWQNFEPDSHGRFELKSSLQYRLNEHHRPLINVWINNLKQQIEGQFPEIIFPQKKFSYISTLDIDNLYAYKHKGFVRTILSTGKDLIKLDLSNIIYRFNVISGKVPDPFDVYEQIIQNSEKTGIPVLFFFLQRSGTKYDRTINPLTGAFRNVFKLLTKKRIPFGLHPSYMALNNPELFAEEVKRIRNASENEVNISRMHYLRWDVKTTPSLLEKNDFIADFSMGFASGSGYRALTFTPFYHFDFNSNQAGNILRVPFAVMDGAYFIYSDQNTQSAEDDIMKIANEAKALNGLFITVFHERTFFNRLYPGFGDLYFRLHQKLSS